MIDIRIDGIEALGSQLQRLPKAVLRGSVNSMNRAGTVSRKYVVDQLSAFTGVKKKLLRRRFYRKNASLQKPTSAIAPSSAGVPVAEYRYSMQRIGTGKNKTRARIRVSWPGGSKVAAGFINPLGKQKRALSTRTSKALAGIPRSAIGPSVAAAWKAMPKGGVESVTTDALVKNLRNDIPKQIAKALGK